MNNKGFVFVETIIVIVVLTTSLLLLYSSFNKVLQSEKTRVYYDDIAYIYRTWYVKNALNNSNLQNAINDLNTNSRYFITIGTEYDRLFEGYPKERAVLSKLVEDFDIQEMVLVKDNKLNNIKTCTKECSQNPKCINYDNCNKVYTDLSDDFKNYLKAVYIDVDCDYFLAIEYKTCNADDTNCKMFYSWVSV